MPLVNIGVIVGDSRDRLTEQCLRSWYEHTDLMLCDLTVIANAVPPATRDLLVALWEEYHRNFTIEWEDEMLGAGAVTNRLLEAARRDQGAYLYHTASDFYFYPGWLNALVANYQAAQSMGIGLFGGYSHPYHLPAGFAVKGIGGYEIVPREMVAGGSWFMAWTIWDTFGPLNELHKGVWIGSEDSEFNRRLIDAKVGRATLIPEVVVHTGRTASNGQPTLGAEYMKDVPGVLIL